MSRRRASHRPDVDAPLRSGLSGADVKARAEAGLGNRISEGSSRSLWQIIRGNVLTTFNSIVAGSFLLLLLLGQWRDALFGFATAGNAVIGVVQEYRAKRSLDRLAVLEAPEARVLRDGAVHNIPVEDVVRDDLLVLRAGDQVAADAAILQSEGLQLDESLLTGESEPVDKGPGTEALSGSSVVAGQGTARVVRVGADSFASRLTAEAKRFSLVHSEIRNSLNRILRWITWALLPVMALVVNGQIQANGDWERALSTGTWRTGAVGAVASIIAMIPLGLVLLTSVAFAVGGVRLARDKVLIQELAAVEGLARVDVLCLDKTGTLTEGRMVFDAVHGAGEAPAPGWEQALGRFGADPNANATARCLAEAFPADGGLRPVAEVGFSSARKWSAVSFGEDHGAAGTWVLGAPELVLTAGAPGTAPALASAATLASAGLRTLVLAHAPGTLPVQDPQEAQLPVGTVPAVLLTFREKVRPDAARTLAYFREQGVVCGSFPAMIPARSPP